MKIELQKITIRQLFVGYVNNEEEGVVAYGGRLDIRPKYQREFIYKDKQRDAVIDTVLKGFPLNVMYWVEKDDGTYEVLDGQQRTLSICEYLSNNFSLKERLFYNLAKDEQEKILNYELMVYFCNGTDSEKLQWFKTINIAGEKLTDQELRNSIYSGTWLTDAKRYFSKRNCQAHNIGGEYMAGSAIRQEYLESVIDWISHGQIEKYMSEHQQAKDANELWIYFQEVLDWVRRTFHAYRNEMKGLPWGAYYNQFKNKKLNSKDLAKEIERLMMDDEVENKKGIYLYLLDGKEKYLNLRAFSPAMKREAFERQAGKCPICKKVFKIEEMEADHKKPWHLGGKTTQENCQLLCRDDNREKSGK